jgi:hypothetical protein
MDSVALILATASSNKILIGMSMLVMNLGARYLLTDLTKLHERILMSTTCKTIVLFSITFVATRDILTALILTSVFYVVVYGLLNENRKLNLWHSSYTVVSSKKQKTYDEAFETFGVK